MKNLLIIFSFAFITGYWFTSATAKQSPQADEIDALMSRISKNIESASQVTKMAQNMNAKMVENKVKEKEAMKEAIVKAEEKVVVMEQVQEMYAAKMIANGIDTSIVEVKLTGPAYDAYLNYVEEGGKESFEYFRLYLWQQK
jgi:hypothetical protein